MEERQVYGYVRVSGRDQNEARQMAALSEYEIPTDRIFTDKQSGKDFERPAYQELIRKLRPGDLMVVHSIDRLGRNYEEILQQWRIITKEIHADIRVLDMPLLDTSIHHDLTGTLIADIVLQLLSYVAENERENIRKRQEEGIREAKARGVKFGRRPIEWTEAFERQAEMWRKGEITGRGAARNLGISHQTFMRKMKTMSVYQAEGMDARGATRRPHGENEYRETCREHGAQSARDE